MLESQALLALQGLRDESIETGAVEIRARVLLQAYARHRLRLPANNEFEMDNRWVDEQATAKAQLTLSGRSGKGYLE